MTTVESTPKMTAGSAGPGPVAGDKTAPPQGDGPVKPIRRAVPKPFRPRVVGEVPAAPVPAVILWDDPVDSADGAKPRG